MVPEMPQSLSSLLTHLVFSTKNREALLTGEVAQQIHPYLVGVLNGVGCPSIQVGGVSDHVHLFFRLSRTRTIAEIVEALKTSSSKWIKTKGSNFASFHWQSGYGAFSVSQSDADAVVAYIQNQPEHHKRVSFQEEYRRFLDRYQIAYDERYVWD
jgi:putative transposase